MSSGNFQMFEGFNENHLEEGKRNGKQCRERPSWGLEQGVCRLQWVVWAGLRPTGSPAALSWKRWATLRGLSASSSQSSQSLPHSARVFGERMATGRQCPVRAVSVSRDPAMESQDVEQGEEGREFRLTVRINFTLCLSVPIGAPYATGLWGPGPWCWC